MALSECVGDFSEWENCVAPWEACWRIHRPQTKHSRGANLSWNVEIKRSWIARICILVIWFFWGAHLSSGVFIVTRYWDKLHGGSYLMMKHTLFSTKFSTQIWIFEQCISSLSKSFIFWKSKHHYSSKSYYSVPCSSLEVPYLLLFSK